MALKQLFTEIRLTAFALSLLGLVGWFTTRSSFRREATDRNVTAVADRLDRQVDRGRYKREDPSSISEKDAWGHPIRVEYMEEGIGERIIVCSAGPDGSFSTEDDITENRFLMNAKGIGEQAKDSSVSVAKDVTKGFIQGIKEELKDTFRGKPGDEQNAAK